MSRMQPKSRPVPQRPHQLLLQQKPEDELRPKPNLHLKLPTELPGQPELKPMLKSKPKPALESSPEMKPEQ